MTNGNSSFYLNNYCGGSNQSFSTEMSLVCQGFRPVTQKAMTGMEVPVGLGLAVVLLGVWAWLRKVTGWALLVVGYVAQGALVQVEYVNTSGGTVGATSANVRRASDGAIVHNWGTMVPGASSGCQSADSQPAGFLYEAQTKNVATGLMGGWFGIGSSSANTVCLKVYVTGGGTNLPPSGTSSGVTNAELKFSIFNSTGSNQNYQVYKDGVPLGIEVPTANGSSFQFDYLGGLGNIEVRGNGGRVVLSAPTSSGYWYVPTPDNTGFPIRWNVVDSGGSGTVQPPPPITWTPGVQTNLQTETQARQAAEIQHADNLQIIGVLRNINASLTNSGGGGGATNDIDYRPFWATNNIALQGVTNRLDGIANNQTNLANMTNLGSGFIGTVLGLGTNAAKGIRDYAVGVASNAWGSSGTNFTALTNGLASVGFGSGLSNDVGDVLQMSFVTFGEPLIADINPLHIDELAVIVPWVLVVLRWALTAGFLYWCWQAFDSKMTALPQVNQSHGSSQEIAGFSVGGPTAFIFALSVTAIFITVAGSWLIVSSLMGELFQDPVSGAVGVVQSGVKLIRSVFPVDWAITLWVAYWGFRVVLLGIFMLAATLIRFHVAVWVGLAVWFGSYDIVTAREVRIANMLPAGGYAEQNGFRFYFASNSLSTLVWPSDEGVFTFHVEGYMSGWEESLGEASWVTLAYNSAEVTPAVYVAGIPETQVALPLAGHYWPWFYGGLAVAVGFVTYGYGQRMVRRAVSDSGECDI